MPPGNPAAKDLAASARRGWSGGRRHRRGLPRCVQHYAREMGIDYLCWSANRMDWMRLLHRHGHGLPVHGFCRRQGRIVTLKIGELHADEAHFILDEVKAIDQGRTELAAAKKQIADGVAALAATRASRKKHKKRRKPQQTIPERSSQIASLSTPIASI